MLGKVIDYLIDCKDRQRTAIALAKGGATMLARNIDPGDPRTWEFSGFSQNGEDGIIDVLRRRLAESNRYVFEIGAADGTENNSSWLLVTGGYEGLLIEGNARQSARANRNIARYSIGSECLAMFVTVEAAEAILDRLAFADPDVFSLDIDGNDYHIANELFNRGLRPKIAVVEYNSAFGPERALTTVYRGDFSRSSAHSSLLYYGVGLAAWRKFFEARGYRFVTVDTNGVNAFFVDPSHFDGSFLDGVHGLEFAENRYQLRAHGAGHDGQFALISDQPFEQV